MAEVTPSTPSFSPVRMRATTEEAAIEQALQIVGATRDEVEVEILEQDAKGVTVRVRPRSATPANAPAAAPASEPVAAPVATEVAPIIEDEEVSDEDIADDADEDEADDIVEVVDDEEEIEAPAPVRQVVRVSEASQQRAQATATEFLERMGMEAEVQVAPGPFSAIETDEEDTQARLYLKIEGNDVGLLIGKHGQTLQAFQYLLNLTLNNRESRDDETSQEDALRVVVDAGGYRSRRATALQQSAHDAAARAKRDRRSIRLEPMPAHERRLIHMMLREDTAITTGSEGREPLRHVVVSPAGMRPSSGGERSSGGRGGYGSSRGGGQGGGRGGYGSSRGGGQGGYGSQRNNSGGGYGSRQGNR